MLQNAKWAGWFALGRAQSLYAGYLQRPTDDFSATEILEGLYLGDLNSALQAKHLTDRRVTHVCTVILGVTPLFPSKYTYHCIDVADVEDENIAVHFENAHRFINEARGKGANVLIHCRAGVSRSASVVISYLMRERRMSLDEALRFVKEKRPVVCPNPGFLRQLKEYEATLNKSGETRIYL